MFKFDEISHNINIEFSNAYFDNFCKDNKNIINNKEWTDLNMDDVFMKICSTTTVLGESILYKILRTPLQNRTDLRQREACINKLSTSKENKDTIIKILKTLNMENHTNILYILKGNLTSNNIKFKHTCYFFLGVILPISLIIASILINPMFILFITLIFFLNTLIHYKLEANLNDKSTSISYLIQILSVANSISKLNCPEIKHHIIKLKQLNEKNKSILQNFMLSIFFNKINHDGYLSLITSIFFLIHERSYYRSINKINENIFYLKETYEVIGEIDALISISEYRNTLNNKFCSPEFTFDNTLLEAINLMNPLIDNCTPNDISIYNSFIITGSHMSGKSTFLKTLGINIIFSRTICTCLAKSFKSSLFNLYTSIKSEDNILKEKSYFLSEVENLYRIINSLSSDVPSFCIIDEIFKGINPIYKISTATEILNYLSSNNAITVISTQDNDLAKSIPSKYSYYNFSGDTIEENRFNFDYKIKKGIFPSSNFIELLNYLNYPQSIVNGIIDKVELCNLK